MIKIQYEGPLPAKIKLGFCGNFKVRPFVPLPTQRVSKSTQLRIYHNSELCQLRDKYVIATIVEQV